MAPLACDDWRAACAFGQVRDMMVIDNEATTIVAFRRMGLICVDAASVTSASGHRALAAGPEDRGRPGQDRLPEIAGSSGASPSRQPGLPT